jgi:hypothetical protein
MLHMNYSVLLPPKGYSVSYVDFCYSLYCPTFHGILPCLHPTLAPEKETKGFQFIFTSPLLKKRGGVKYSWQPVVGKSRPSIKRPR